MSVNKNYKQTFLEVLGVCITEGERERVSE
jgi:hypothetical protein